MRIWKFFIIFSYACTHISKSFPRICPIHMFWHSSGKYTRNSCSSLSGAGTMDDKDSSLYITRVIPMEPFNQFYKDFFWIYFKNSTNISSRFPFQFFSKILHLPWPSRGCFGEFLQEYLQGFFIKTQKIQKI